jgi:hypothetical protein
MIRAFGAHYHNPTFPGVSLIKAGAHALMREGAASVDL